MLLMAHKIAINYIQLHEDVVKLPIQVIFSMHFKYVDRTVSLLISAIYHY